MISLILKHKITEICINHIFDTIKSNFKKSDEIKVGDFYKKIEFSRLPAYNSESLIEVYRNCRIMDIYSETYLGCVVNFYFFESNGNEMMISDVDKPNFIR